MGCLTSSFLLRLAIMPEFAYYRRMSVGSMYHEYYMFTL